MSNRNYNTQTNPNRQKLMNGGRAKKNMGGSMNPAMARQDMASGYYPSDMGMEGGAMYAKGGPVKKVLSPQQEKAAVEAVKNAGMSERKACQLVGLSRGTYRYRPAGSAL